MWEQVGLTDKDFDASDSCREPASVQQTQQATDTIVVRKIKSKPNSQNKQHNQTAAPNKRNQKSPDAHTDRPPKRENRISATTSHLSHIAPSSSGFTQQDHERTAPKDHNQLGTKDTANQRTSSEKIELRAGTVSQAADEEHQAMNPTEQPCVRSGHNFLAIWSAGTFLVVVCLIAILSPLFSDEIAHISEELEGMGAGGAVLAILVLVVWQMALLPPVPLAIGCAVVFSYGVAFIIILASFMIGSCLCFVIARKFALEKARRFFYSQYVWLRAIEVIATEHPWISTVLLKFSMVPVAIKSYGIGTVAPITFQHYALVSMASSCVSAVLWTSIGTSATSAADIIENGGSEPEQLASLIIGAVFLIIFLAASCVATRRLYRTVNSVDSTA